MLSKIASVIHSPKPTLAPEVWDENAKLRPEIRRRILSDVLTLEEEDSKVKAVYILGSLTGYKYSDTSDLDVMVAMFPLDPSRGKTHGARQLNGRMAPGTNRPISYFLVEWKNSTDAALSEADYGVYDVLADGWTSPPPERVTVREPSKEFKFELIRADMVSREFSRRAEKYLQAKIELDQLKADPSDSIFHYGKLKAKAREVENFYKSLIQLVERLDKERKIDYSSGWGIGRKSAENIAYKTVQYGPHGDLFNEVLEYTGNKNLKESDE